MGSKFLTSVHVENKLLELDGIVIRNMKTGKPRAVVLMSGGMDSCVAASIAARDFEICGVHLSYGQRTEARERKAFLAQADYFAIRTRLVVDLPHLGKIGGSSLTDRAIEVPDSDTTDAGVSGAIPNTYVPFRNAHFLATAVSWAEVLGAHRIYIGAVEQDSSGYPDCRPEYYAVMNQLIEVGTRPETGIRIETPLIRMRKSEIVRRGLEMGAPLQHTWSCYRSERQACGRCDSCALRLRAFEEAGEIDTIPYEERTHYARI